MKIMRVRIGLFHDATVLYQKIGISLLKGTGSNVAPLEQSFGGEAGAFYFVPLVAKFFCLSPEVAVWYFFTSLAMAGTLIAGIALYVLAKTGLGRVIALCGTGALGFISLVI